MSEVQTALGISERRACQVLEQPRSTQRYIPQEDEEEQRLVSCILEIVREHPRYGYRFVTALLKQDGWRVNRKRVYRLWVQEGLKVPRKQRKKRRLGNSKNGCSRQAAEFKNQVWAWDFVFDRTANGRPIKWLSIVDEYTRECLALEVNRKMTSEDLLDVLRDLLVIRGVPKHIRSDNGPEFIARAMREFLANAGIETLYVEPGSPWQNGYAESFHSRLRSELLDAEVFETVAEAQGLSAAWKNEYNHRRPHSSLGYQTPAAFATGCAASAPATPALQQHTRKEEIETVPLTLTQPVLS